MSESSSICSLAASGSPSDALRAFSSQKRTRKSSLSIKAHLLRRGVRGGLRLKGARHLPWGAVRWTVHVAESFPAPAQPAADAQAKGPRTTLPTRLRLYERDAMGHG